MTSSEANSRHSRGSGTAEGAANKRRSQRLFIQVKVVIEGKVANLPPLKEETHTIVVNAHGALVEMSAQLDPGQQVNLRNVRTNNSIECVVKLVTPAGAGKFSTALEFTKPDPKFWRVSFPPEDWTTRSPDAKKIG
jgi:hypothetical protein